MNLDERAAARFFIRRDKEMKLSEETTGEIRVIAEQKWCRLLAVECAGALSSRSSSDHRAGRAGRSSRSGLGLKSSK